jgi:hypothetical protein
MLQSKAGFQVVGEPTESENQLRIIGRLPGNQGIEPWLLVVRQMLLMSEEADWKVDVSKQYFLKNGKVVYGWRLIFQAIDVPSCLQAIIQSVVSAPKPTTREVMEMPLLGASADRNNMSVNGKGAGGVLSTAVGGAAIARRRMGG